MSGESATPATSRTWSHEQSYRGLRPEVVVHRARLSALLSVLERLDLPAQGAAADFGCSNGFILEQLRARLLPAPAWRLHGFDHAPALLEMARAKGIEGASFEGFDLNRVVGHLDERYDLVLCLQTLEHTGDYRAAVRNLYRACRPGGLIVISVPNETGVPGVIKFVARALIRRNPYRDFFSGTAPGSYLRALLTGADIERFRTPPRDGWGPHLGFDIRRFESFLQRELVAPHRCRMVMRRRSFVDFDRFYVLRRLI